MQQCRSPVFYLLERLCWVINAVQKIRPPFRKEVPFRYRDHVLHIGGQEGEVALVSAAVYRQLSWKLIVEACLRTYRLTGMIMWILFGAYCFSAAYHGMGASHLIEDLMKYIPGGPWGTIIFIQAVIFLLAMVLDPAGIMMICVPVFLPVVKAHGFDPLWFGILFVINMEIGYMTPPFGFNLFYLKGIVPPGITMGDIYRSVIPFTFVESTGLALVMVFPKIATWLPYKMF